MSTDGMSKQELLQVIKEVEIHIEALAHDLRFAISAVSELRREKKECEARWAGLRMALRQHFGGEE